MVCLSLRTHPDVEIERTLLLHISESAQETRLIEAFHSALSDY